MQGPSKQWMEHSLKLHFLKLQSRGAPISNCGCMDHIIVFSKSLHHHHLSVSVHWGLVIKLLKHRQFLINQRFWLLRVELKKSVALSSMNFLFYKHMINIKFDHVLCIVKYFHTFSKNKLDLSKTMVPQRCRLQIAEVLGVPGLRGFRKKDRKRDRQSITTSTPGFKNLSTALIPPYSVLKKLYVHSIS